MKTQDLLAALHADLSSTSIQRVGGGYYAPLAEPRYLAPLLEASLDTDQERERYRGGFRSSPGEIHEYLEDGGWMKGLVHFHWLGMGPISWSGGFTLVGPRDHAWLAWWDEFSQYRAIAVLRGADDPQVVAAAVRGALLGCPPFSDSVQIGCLPDSTCSTAPDLLSAESLHAAYTDFLDQGDQEDWRAFVDRCIVRGLEPNHLRLSLQVLEATADRVERMAAGQIIPEEDRGAPPSPAVRRACFEDFWRRSHCG